MYTCTDREFSQYFQDHHFKLKLNRNAARYRFLSKFAHWLLFKTFVQKLCEKKSPIVGTDKGKI